jgi:RimJ/RimL family protein N-acetyltransferase
MPVETAAYPIELNDHLILPNRRHVNVRALRRCEEDPIRELDAHLSLQTRYHRFLSPFPRLPDSLVRLLACVDYRRSLALVVERETEAREVVGLGSFGAADDSGAEVALLVRDDWQRQHVGIELARRVLLAAESRGYHRFTVHVHADNVAIRRLLQQVGRIVSSKMSGGVSELTFVRQFT